MSGSGPDHGRHGVCPETPGCSLRGFLRADVLSVKGRLLTGEVDGLPFWTTNPPENPAGSCIKIIYPFVLKCLCDEIQAKEHDKDIGTAFHGQAETLVSSGFGNADAASCQDNGQTVPQAEQNGHQDAA